MMEIIWMIEPWHWLVFGFLLMIAEIFIPTFASLWFGAAAVIVAALAWFLPVPIVIQILIWLSLSILFMFAWIKYIKPLSMDRRKASLSGSTIIGETGMVIVKPSAKGLGMLRFSVPIFGADEWVCRSTDDTIQAGDRVVVTGIEGDELIVAHPKRLEAIAVSQPDININQFNINDPSNSKHRELVESKITLHKSALDKERLNKKFTDN